MAAAEGGGRSEPTVDESLAAAHGLNDEEYQRLCAFLGRVPSYTELGIASALWSEHCSYKSSKSVLRLFPTSGPRVVQGPGENAGIVELGEGWVAAFKMESHNHPSYIEPYQGAATGVGGILRDIFTMGARPIACLDALRFGDLEAPRMRHLVDGVVRGIGDYGNCVGIPTVGGETGFHRSFDGNILVNAFALGIAHEEAIFRARASGAGNPVLYGGSRTGRDGIHGATMASESFDAESESKRPTVQVGDPFTEKVLLEASLEAMQSGALVAVQDMGAAGLTSSCFEMASRGAVGMALDLDRVPLREQGLVPYEMMLSESQERMVLVAERGKEGAVEEIFDRWGLELVPIGRVTPDGRVRISFRGEVVADMPVAPLTDEAPVYERRTARPEDLEERQRTSGLPELDDPAALLVRLLGTPELGDKSWIYGQYDSTVQTNTVRGPGGDAAVLRLKGTTLGLALTTDTNPVYCSLDPRRGGQQAVAEAARNLACVGAEPIGLTDCLNFGNPERPEIAWQLRECVEGMAEACRALGVPVVSGNVSLYNETEGRSIYPTPTVAMVGLIPELRPELARRLGSGFRQAGDRVVLLGEDRLELGGSACLRLLFGLEQGLPPRVSLAGELALGRLLRRAWSAGWLSSAHDLAEGGLLVALAEAAFAYGLGARLRVPEHSPPALFSESQGRAVVTVPPAHLDALVGAAEGAGVVARDIGEVGGDRLEVHGDGARVDLEVERLHRAWRQALPRALEL